MKKRISFVDDVANACTGDEAARDVHDSSLDEPYLTAAGVLGRLPTWRAAFNARQAGSLSP